jgi:ABC-type transporter Mla subunit MlaD
MARQVEALGAQAQNALANVQTANAGFADEAGALGLHAQQAEQQMRGVLSVTAGLQEQTRQIRESMQSESARVIEQMNAAIAQLDMTTQMLKTQGSAASQVMDQTVLQFASSARASSDEMLKQVDVLHDAVDRAENKLNAAGENVRGHLKLVSDMGDQSEAQARQLADSAEYATNRLAALRDTFADADTDSQKIVSAATDRIKDSRAQLQGELASLAQLSHETVQNLSSATASLTGQNEQLRNNLAMSESALQEAAALVREENAQLPALFDRSTAKIETTIKALKERAGEADTVLVGTADRFISVTSAARESIMNEMRRISATAEQANGLLGNFSKALTEQMEAFKDGTSTLSREQIELVTKAGESVTQLAAANDRLASLRADATQTAQRLVEEFDSIDRRAAVTNQRLTETSNTVVKTVDSLTQAAGRAEAQMTGASGQFREQLERIRAGLQGQIEDINRGLMQITAQLERTGTTLRTSTAGTVADVERIAQRFDLTSKETSAQLTEKTARMRASAEDVAKLLGGFGDQIDTLLNRMASAGEGIRRNETQLTAPLEKAMTQLSAICDKLEAGRMLATNVSGQTIASLSEVVESIQREVQNLSAGSQTAAGIMRGIGQIYGEQTQNLNQGVREAHGQVQTMSKSIDDMQQRTDRMRVSLKMQGEELMGTLQHILGELSKTGDTLGETVDDELKARIEDGRTRIM